MCEMLLKKEYSQMAVEYFYSVSFTEVLPLYPKKKTCIICVLIVVYNNS